jgi:hypothetical protein
MRIKNKFAVPDAWIILNDIPRVARAYQQPRKRI